MSVVTPVSADKWCGASQLRRSVEFVNGAISL